MSRYHPDVNAAPILQAAEHWRDQALLHDGSVFSPHALWSIDNLEQLKHSITQNPSDDRISFREKLQRQLEPAPPAIKQLAAELNWLLLLCPDNTKPESKCTEIRRVWEWSGEALPDTSEPWVNSEVLAGIGSAGIAYNTFRWREFGYAVEVCLAFKRLPLSDRESLLKDGWGFAEWLQTIDGSNSRQLRHMLLFLLFPDTFERIFGDSDRKAVVHAFGQLSRVERGRLPAVELDRVLFTIRTKLEQEYGTQELDFYVPPLADRWRRIDFKTLEKQLDREHVLKALADIDRDGVPPNAQSLSYDVLHEGKRYPPKYVLSIAAEYAVGTAFDRNHFEGGEGTPAFNLLRKLGFDIVPKTPIPDLIQRFLAQAQAGTSLKVADYPKTYRNLKITVSFGQGDLARVPWIAFLESNQRISQGIYPALLNRPGFRGGH